MPPALFDCLNDGLFSVPVQESYHHLLSVPHYTQFFENWLPFLNIKEQLMLLFTDRRR